MSDKAMTKVSGTKDESRFVTAAEMRIDGGASAA
jgi:hypothetical protein